MEYLNISMSMFFIFIPLLLTNILYSQSLERLPFSSERLLTEPDLKGFSKYDLKIARNEIFARKGYDFKGRLRDHFSKFSSYLRGKLKAVQRLR